MNQLIIISLTLITYFLNRGYVYYPDSVRYESDERQHYPFNLRLIHIQFPTVLFIPILTYYYLLPFTSQAMFGALLVLGLSGIYKQNVKGYKLIDGTAICFGLLSTICFNADWYIPALIFLILASLTKETMPVFIALWSMSFLPLIGFLTPLVIYLFNPPVKQDILGEGHQQWLDNPFKAFKEYHIKNLLSPFYFLSWGVCITAVLYQGEYWQWVLASVLIAYAQLLVATDRGRLFMYSFPLAILATCLTIELNWLLILIHLYNPFHFIEQGYSKEEYLKIKEQIK